MLAPTVPKIQFSVPLKSTRRRATRMNGAASCMLQPLVMLRLALLLLVFTLLPMGAQAQGVSARFSNQVAIQGQDVEVEVLLEDPAQVVTRIQVELRRPTDATWTATTAAATASRERWVSTFPASIVWASPPADTLEVRALLYGRRGGLILVVGELEPFEMDALPPALAEARRRALTRPHSDAPATGADTVPIAGYVGVGARMGSTARARVFIGAGGPLGDTLELRGLILVGPSFSEPQERAGGGPFVLGVELDLRAYVCALSASTWNLFAQPFLGVDLRLPGVDLVGGLRAGGLYWISQEVALEASLGGGPVVFGLSAPAGERTALGFSGGLQLGVRFGPERQ